MNVVEWGLRRKKFQKKKAPFPLYLLLLHVVDSFGQLNLNMQAQSVRLGVDAQLVLVSSIGVCVKGCAEEEDVPLAQGFSSFMLPGESCVDVVVRVFPGDINALLNSGCDCFEVLLTSIVSHNNILDVAGQVLFHKSLTSTQKP